MNSPWLNNFGFRKNPFRDTIDSDLFFRTRQHEEAMLKIRIGIEDRHALILLTGLSGTGKTLAAQVAVKDLDASRYEIVFAFVYPGMGKGALLGAVLEELGKEAGRFLHEKLAVLQKAALDLHQRGRRLVIIIDEAHFLKADALHILRTLSNLENEQEKLVSVLLIAEDSINRRLRAPSYRSLRGRITFNIKLSALSADDLEQYVKFRLLKCGGSTEILSQGLYPLVHAATEGVPREVNKLLYAGFIDAATRKSRVTDDILRTVSGKVGCCYG